MITTKLDEIESYWVADYNDNNPFKAFLVSDIKKLLKEMKKELKNKVEINYKWDKVPYAFSEICILIDDIFKESAGV